MDESMDDERTRDGMVGKEWFSKPKWARLLLDLAGKWINFTTFPIYSIGFNYNGQFFFLLPILVLTEH